MTAQERPVLPHLVGEFLLWVWYASERGQGSIDLGEDIGAVELWVDQRLSFRALDEERARAVFTGENPASTREARAALAGGKVIQDLRLGLRRDGREYTLGLRGLHLDVQAAKLPTECRGEEDEVLYERMFLYEDLHHVLRGLYRRFAAERGTPAWTREHLPAMRAWANSGPGGATDGWEDGEADSA